MAIDLHQLDAIRNIEFGYLCLAHPDGVNNGSTSVVILHSERCNGLIREEKSLISTEAMNHNIISLYQELFLIRFERSPR